MHKYYIFFRLIHADKIPKTSAVDNPKNFELLQHLLSSFKINFLKEAIQEILIKKNKILQSKVNKNNNKQETGIDTHSRI